MSGTWQTFQKQNKIVNRIIGGNSYPFCGWINREKEKVSAWSRVS